MKPQREHATNNAQTYMVTSSTWERRALFQDEPWAKLLIETLNHYQDTAYLLHEFVIMPDHFHALITPQTSLEKAVQFIKGDFSYRARKELSSIMFDGSAKAAPFQNEAQAVPTQSDAEILPFPQSKAKTA
jgi:REP element-mobilizing transposase RayT